jgi:hypothetical protein
MYMTLIIIYILLILIFLSVIINHYPIVKNISNFTNIKRKKIAIVTAIFGNYDNIKDHYIDNYTDVDWYCFTDDANLIHNKFWKVILTPYHDINNTNIDNQIYYKNEYSNIKDNKTMNMMKAKYYKAKTHEIDILKNYDYFIWIDGSLTLRDQFINNINKIIDIPNNELINFRHSARNNITDESNLCHLWSKYIDQNLDNQVKYYKKEGFKDDAGLFELTCIIKKNNDRVNKVFDLWWTHNLQHSYQDQISYPFVLWKLKIKPDHIIEENVMNNTDFTIWNSHN